MKPIKTVFWSVPVGLTVLWLLADSSLLTAENFFQFRRLLMQYSGVIAMAAMSVCMILAVRPRFVDKFLGGLDKGYRLHKWAGILALTASVLHWLVKESKDWLKELGLITFGKKPPMPEFDLSTVQGMLSTQWHNAESVGEIAFYVAVVLMIMALVKLIPYRWFVKLHTVLAAVYLALVFHGVVLMDFAYWTQPLGWLMAVFMAAGSVAAVLVLFGQVGKSKQYQGVVKDCRYQAESQTLAVDIALSQGRLNFKSGQFVFLKTDKWANPHPFTIASAPQSDIITLMIKNLGAYTAALPQNLNAGDKVRIEGAYGGFTFDGKETPQIWVSGGIGYTPFLARALELAQHHANQNIVWYHSSTNDVTELEQAAQVAGIRFIHIDTRKQSRLNGQTIRNEQADWKNAGVWFCGVTEFGKQLHRDLKSHGLKGGFHQECFEMR